MTRDDRYESAFDPGTYLRTYYATAHVAEDEVLNLTHLTRFVKGGNRYPRALEVGCGPTVHHALPLAPHVGEMHLSDYLPANLAEVRRWLDRDPDAHDWSVYVRGVLAIEGGDTSDAAVRARADELRSRVTALKVCDLLRDDPLGEPATYDLVTCFYTAECSARDRAEWERVMRRLAGLVAPGGTLFQVSMRNCERYAVGDRHIAAVPVDESDLAAALPACGFDPAATTVTPVRVAEWAGTGSRACAWSPRGRRVGAEHSRLATDRRWPGPGRCGRGVGVGGAGAAAQIVIRSTSSSETRSSRRS